MVVVPLLDGAPKDYGIALRAVQQRRQGLLDTLAWDLLDRLVDLAQRLLQLTVPRDRNRPLLEPQKRGRKCAGREIGRKVRSPGRLQRFPRVAAVRRRYGCPGFLVFRVQHRTDQRVLLELLKRRRALLGIPQQLPQPALEILSPP